MVYNYQGKQWTGLDHNNKVTVDTNRNEWMSNKVEGRAKFEKKKSKYWQVLVTLSAAGWAD